MRAKGRLVAYLRAYPGLDFCQDCLAEPLGIRNTTVYQLALELESSPEFNRGYRRCSACGRIRLVTRGHARRDAA